MRPRGQGTIVQVGSALAYRGIPLQSAYCGAKHAIQGFTESVRAELAHDGSDIHLTMVQLPALNTPQFSWVLSRLPAGPSRSRPSTSRSWPGAPSCGRPITAAASGGSAPAPPPPSSPTAVAPGLLDRYLGRTGVDAQQTDEPAGEHQPANLWDPVDAREDHGAHGEFDDRAHDRSVQWALTRHRRSVLAAGAALGAVMVWRARR
jgi:hypothetical protein